MKVSKTKRSKASKTNATHASAVWMNPNSSFKGPRVTRTWDQDQLAPPRAARLLELADIALGSIQPSHPPARKKKAAA